MTASADALEHKQGFLNAMSPAGEVDLDTPTRFGRHSWLITEGLGFKLYPMCYGTHRALDGVIALAHEHDVAPADIAEICIEAGEVQLANLVHHDPQTALDAKFSMEFAVAMALIARRATLAEVKDSFVQRADVRALMKKVRIRLVSQPDAGRNRVSGDGVIVTLNNGKTLERRFDLPLGHAERPVGADALWVKFADCTRGALSEAQARSFFDLLQRLDTVDSIAEFPVLEAKERA
ncbi:MAG: hypothetical protein A2W04_02570 [Betaproteobacteria bacterium RBG_16_64_9]|nr:MAG: hypothetical protein A2W04_02570 [Betaproteobacteria bacterium RBG_16_64_9]